MASYRDVTQDQIKTALPKGLPDGIAAIIKNYYDREPLSFNTDWAGTMPMWGLTMWAKRGVPGALDCVKAWFEAHLERDPKLSDEEFKKTYNGHGARTFRGRHLPFTMYCGLFGMIYPCAELFLQTGDQRAREVCIDVANAIMYHARRNRYGLLAHDDHWVYDIPDAGFFNIHPLKMAALVADKNDAYAYTRMATTQLRNYIDVFLNRKLGLSHTLIGPEGLGKTFWGRAQGWLIWCFIAGMRDLPEGPELASFKKDLEFFCDGLMKAVDEDGSIHAFANDRQTLQETTGTAMVALSIHEALRRGWLPKGRYETTMEKMWAFTKKHVTPDGGFEKVYYEWALPAELYVESSKTVKYGPHIGALLWTADEMTTA
jgi:rhamnogalacturonyl hydrolase YesR